MVILPPMAAARNRTIALVITLVALGVACSPQAAPDTPTAQLGTAPADAPTTEAPSDVASEPADPYAIPADPKDIDKEYVERVVEALNEGVVVATREIGEHRRLTATALDALAATHLPSSRRGYLASFREVLSNKRTTKLFRADAESVDVVQVKKVFSASKDCVFALVRQDTSGLIRRPVPPFDVYYHLSASRTPDPGLNKTPWMVAADSQPRGDGKRFEDPCAGS